SGQAGKTRCGCSSPCSSWPRCGAWRAPCTAIARCRAIPSPATCGGGNPRLAPPASPVTTCRRPTRWLVCVRPPTGCRDLRQHAVALKTGPRRAGRSPMKRIVLALSLVALLAPTAPAGAADDSKVKSATGQVESGAKKIGQGKVGDGIEETAKGIGHTVAEGAKYTGEKLKESSKAAEPEAKSTWQNLKETANSFGGTVKNFFSNLFGS